MNKQKQQFQPCLPASGLVLLGMAASYLIGHLLGDKSKEKKITYFKKSEIDSNATFKQQGWDLKNGYVDLRSFDEGRNWYVVQGEDSENVLISGKAEEIYPGLLKEKMALARLNIQAACWQQKELN